MDPGAAPLRGLSGMTSRLGRCQYALPLPLAAQQRMHIKLEGDGQQEEDQPDREGDDPVGDVLLRHEPARDQRGHDEESAGDERDHGRGTGAARAWARGAG